MISAFLLVFLFVFVLAALLIGVSCIRTAAHKSHFTGGDVK